ncbi:MULTISPECIES: type II secretion system inner membrane protein GspF [unclassified Sphingopyxis]|uniref:type II secretion system inner membrane protein GspF n=1 Tax=unclassified Sphingopyxis TaxID=2614943 RepID=UPI000731A4A7|nr:MULTISPECIES: type II secretion system inner membrane protein GspF [unclassified Sphingopyxis]KTE22327.1 type II secretion system protein GspF [Sphingopyxis sp. H057]KTE49964.1 type II secretion system protein GspF [Sphingopyxis sp. H071]KTE51223.1 type II secretion system protein GspF [Sphingopyxis sp. H073]KTE59086.1 type II secretion system protein GspF [Sphingopyxis sp. H107]KTE60634.1 type II secretion system protein GspF [Sphingopyxis sp. H100]
MPDYRYVAIDSQGRERKGRLAAANDDAARADLVRRKFHIVAVEEAGTKPTTGRSLLAFRRGKLSSKELALFTRQLATLVEVAPLEEALRTLTRQSEAESARAVIGDVHAGLLEGRRLADAMARQPGSFPPLYRAMVAAGETTGSLTTILARLADLLERQAEVRGKLIAALAYPVVLAVVAIGVVAALMIFVVPRVVEQFNDVGQQLPFLTRAVIAISSFAASWWWLIALLIAVATFGWVSAMRRPAFKAAVDARLLGLPLFGRLLRDLYAARFARTLSTMVSSRLPLVEGLRLTVPTIRNAALAGATASIVDQVRAGGSLSAALRDAGVFPPLLVYMTASGESAGRVEQMLERAADYLEREFDRFTAASMALLEPVIIVVMGSCVALIILAILLPILQLQNLAGL